jgi:hypothetical protein
LNNRVPQAETEYFQDKVQTEGGAAFDYYVRHYGGSCNNLTSWILRVRSQKRAVAAPFVRLRYDRKRRIFFAFDFQDGRVCDPCE